MKIKTCKKIKRTALLLLVFTMATSILPQSSFRIGAHTYKGDMSIEIKTSDDDKAGTSQPIYFELFSRGERKISQHIDEPNYDDFEQGDQRVYDYTWDNVVDPWLYDTAGFKMGSNLTTSPRWKIGWSTIQMKSPFNGNKVTLADKFIKDYWLDKNETIKFGINTKRNIHDISVFTETFRGDHYVGSGTSETINITNKKDMTISDQYGTYNPYEHAESPTLRVNTNYNGVNYDNFMTIKGDETGFKYVLESQNKAAFLDTMRKNNVFDITSNASWNFPTLGANAVKGSSSTFNIHRLEYQEEYNTSTGKVNPPENPMNTIVGADNNYYYNAQTRELQWKVKYFMPKPIFAVWDTMPNGPVVKVYRGNGTSSLIGTAKVTRTKVGSNIGYLNCSLTLPENYTTEDAGISLEVSNTDITIAGQGTYRLGMGVGTSSNRYAYFSEYKVDTKLPQTELVNKNGSPLVLNENKKEQTFYIRSNEALEKGTAVFTLQKNNSTEPVSFKPLDGNNTNNIFSDVQPITTEVLNKEYRLAVAEGMEGYFDLNIKFNDMAKNNGEQTVKKIVLDNKVPSIDVSSIPKVPDALGDKRTDFPFTIQDFQEKARVYYCFVPKKDALDVSGAKDAEETELNLIAEENKWYFVEKSAETTTASMKVAKGENFEGTLYYFGDDGVGNKTSVRTISANIYNEETQGTLTIEDDTPALSEYNIHFTNLNGNVASYQWIEKNANSSGFAMDMKTYSNENIGENSQIGKDGKAYLLNGSYTLKYQLKNNVSGNIKEYEKDFVFDNSNPSVSLPQWDNGQRVRAEQTAVIRISDLSGLKQASYQVTDLKGNPMKDFEDKKNLPINEDGNVLTSIQLSGLDNGIYGLKIFAVDNNGFNKTVWYGGSEGSFKEEDEWNDVRMTFAIRSLAPTMTWEVKDIALKDNDRYLTKDHKYTIDITMQDSMTNVPSEGFFENFMKYQVSSDGSNWSEWRSISDTPMQPIENAFQGVISIPEPIPLYNDDGVNTIYIRTACYSSGDAVTDITLPQSISESLKVEITKDSTGPQADIVYKKVEPTAEDVQIEVQLNDTYTDTEYLTLDIREEDREKISIEKDTSTAGKFLLTVKENVDTTLIAKDRLGNSSDVMISVRNIDKTPPEAAGTIKTVENGERVDAMAEVNIQKMDPFNTSYALASGRDVTTFTQADYDRFDAFYANNLIEITTQDATLPNGDVDRVQTLSFKGFDGDWTLGVSAQDVLGNQKTSALVSFHVVNAEAQLKDYAFVPEITKSKTVGTFHFNVPVVVLSEDQIIEDEEENLDVISSMGSQATDEEMLTEYQKTFSEKQEVVLYISDSIGNAKKVIASMDSVSFVEGFDINVSYMKNDTAFENDGSWISMTQNDHISAIVEADKKYPAQYFYISEDSDSDMSLDEEKSIKTTYAPLVPDVQEDVEDKPEEKSEESQSLNNDKENVNIPNELIGKQLYSKLVFQAKHNGKTVKTARFSSYTEEGNAEDRNQNEVVTISNIDETLPESELVYSTLQPTNQDVKVQLNAKDAQSGIVLIEEKTKDHGYTTIYENELSSPSATVISAVTSNDDVHTFKITNRAGMVYETMTSVSNIDKTTIEKDKHYSVQYIYQAGDLTWDTADADKAYQSVKAMLIPIEGSEKVLSVKNNQGQFSVQLDQQNAAFDMQLQDQAGNEIIEPLLWEHFDTTAPVIKEPEYDHSLTNQAIEVTINVTDSSQVNKGEIRDCQLLVQGGDTIPLEKDANGVYQGYVPQSGVYIIKAWDYAGNASTHQFTVSNIDTTKPVATKINYSVAKDIVTSGSVVVTAESFNKHVQGFTIEPVSGNDLRFVTYTEGSNTVRFLKNGSVNLIFKDDYGNVGTQLLTVDNIKITPPNVEAIVTYAKDLLQAEVSFKVAHVEGVMDDDLKKLFITSPLLNAGKQTGILDANGDSVKIKIKENGTYAFKISDEAGNTQLVNVDVDKIDKSAPKILSVEWAYNYLDPNANWNSALQRGQHLVLDGEKEFKLNNELLPNTNQDVKVTVTTDKDVSQIGSNYGTYAKTSSMVYTANGLFSFNLEAVNGTSAFYGVGVDLIDKDKPVITFEEGQELIFVQNASDPSLSYDKAKLYDFKAFDNDNVNITDHVEIKFGNFNPDDINSNIFNRNSPYYIVYTVRDKAGNITEITRTIRLIGLTDTVVLINGSLPTKDVVTVDGSSMNVELKNFSGKAYTSYWKGSLTMGEMKSKERNVQPNNKGVFKINKLEKGWYTVNVQTDKKDFFNVNVYVNP